MAASVLQRFHPLLRAASYAARAHRSQVRKDGQTPYIAHPFRVCLIVRHVFAVDDPDTILAALLHDTVEDTNTDWDDIARDFGDAAANHVAALSKDKRSRDEWREAAYMATLANSPPAVIFCKLADIFDNLIDSLNLSPEERARTIERSRNYLGAMTARRDEANRAAFAWVEQLLAEVESAPR